MSIYWVIEKFRGHEEQSDHLILAARDLGCIVIEYHPYRGLDRAQIAMLSSGPVVFHGSCHGAKMFKRECPNAFPGSAVVWDNYRCSTYYKHWGDLCLNTPTASIMTLESVFNNADDIFRLPKFIRPDSGDKLFPGEVFPNAETVCEELIKPLLMNGSTLGRQKVVVAEPQALGREWRIFYNAAGMTPGVICGSQYRRCGKQDLDQDIPISVYDWVQENFDESEWHPAPIFVLDVVEVLPKKTLRLLEIGSANVAGLYASDVFSFVKAMSFEAKKQYTFFPPR